MGRGFFIVLEGVDGVGKTTQARLLAEALRERGYRVALTREPSDGPTGAKIRDYLQGQSRHLKPEEELALFLADRREHVEKLIRPSLEQGMVVVSDRYYFSSAAYQGALGLDPEKIVAEHQKFAPGPDLVIILHLLPAAALARRRHKPVQVMESPDYLERVAAIYATFTGPGVRHLAAARPVEEVHRQILAITLDALAEQGRSQVAEENAMSMWFFDEAGEMQEYQRVKDKFSSLEKEYLELRELLRDNREALRADPQSEHLKARVQHLEKRVKNLEEQYPWLTWETPVEVALFTPPHG